MSGGDSIKADGIRIEHLAYGFLSIFAFYVGILVLNSERLALLISVNRLDQPLIFFGLGFFLFLMTALVCALWYNEERENKKREKNEKFSLIQQLGAPDYETARLVKVRGFPDYDTYLEGVEKGVVRYKLLKILKEGEYRDGRDMIKCWKGEIGDLLSRINQAVLKKESGLIKSKKELDNLKSKFESDSGMLQQSKEKLLVWQDLLLQMMESITRSKSDIYSDSSRKKILNDLNKILKSIRYPLHNLSNWRKDLRERKIECEQNFKRSTNLLQIIQTIKPGIQTSLSRIAELTQITPDTAQSILKQILHHYPEIGEYHEFEQVFVKREDTILVSPAISDSQRISFFCQLDNERHPASESAYECQSCGRKICHRCYIDCQSTGISTCPYCQGELVKIQ